ncbi:hypothetical protein B0H67DRAFT_608892 [Lasiosphaeris hirsuta]|uniref:NAD(P)-binding protein n=1 Tax=Lasiosphaeris hirsuta TaxID=260670 RepID=A0AA40AQL4_9PEZI|nr:hypothetical protein B0H67DRAFT_608892 [Lasiosphaeris hirsuta]
MVETVLVVGATGNIGVSAVKGALNSGRKVLAVVRSQASADKLVKQIGSSEGITFTEASVLSDTGVKGVVDLVRAGKLPAFQHVYACVGGEYSITPLLQITIPQLRSNLNASFEANFFAYQATVGYLLEQNNPNSTWTMCTGSQGDVATHPVPAFAQGALFSFATAAARENESTNIRFNEVYLMFRVEVDAEAAAHGVSGASEFAAVYEGILANPEIRSGRVKVETPADFKDLKWAKKF